MKRKLIIKTIKKFAGISMVAFLQITLLIGLTNNAIAQELNPSVISSGGETFTASGYFLDFVIGEIVTESFTEQEVMLTQGFLQGKEGETSINEQTINADNFDVYPNPSSNMVYIKCKGNDKPIRIEIFGIMGCMVYSVQFNNNLLAVSLEQLNPGIYVLKLIFPDQNFITKKIIKK